MSSHPQHGTKPRSRSLGVRVIPIAAHGIGLWKAMRGPLRGATSADVCLFANGAPYIGTLQEAELALDKSRHPKTGELLRDMGFRVVRV